MDKKLIIKKHTIADRFPLILAAVLMMAGQYFPMTAASYIAEPLSGIPALEESALTIFAVLAIILSFVMLWAFRRWFYPEYEGCCGLKDLGYGMKAALPVIIFIIAWKVFKVAVGFELFKITSFYPVLMGSRAGINEEAAFRGIAVALLLRSFRSEKNIWIPPVFTGVFFGCTHLLNILAGDEILNTVVNTVFASAVGVLFGILFTMSGNIWPVLIAHSLYDALAFASIDNDMPDAVTLIEVGAFIVIMVIYLWVLHRNREKAAALWDRKWKNGKPAEPLEDPTEESIES